jgi:adenosine kinase
LRFTLNFLALKKMAALICGSLAFDTIMNFEGQFADQIMPDQIHNLSVSFIVPSLRREFGGCAGNIAYGLKQLGGDALPMATVGADGADYVERFKQLGIATDFVTLLADHATAQCTIMTDRVNNQITAFHPGAMFMAHTVSVQARSDIRIGIIAPDGREAMQNHAQQMHAAGIPFIFDPGQNLPLFNRDELLHFIDQADWIAVNDYEGNMLCERTGLSAAQISQRVQGLVITLGEQGSEVWTQGQREHIASVKASQVIDPTGCGDAFRAALLYGLERDWPLKRCAELGSRIGALKIAQRGGQNYQLNHAELGL